MRQAPCQPNLLKFSNMCQRNYPAPSDIYLLPNPAVAPRPHKCSACANDEPGPGAATQELALTKICPSLPPTHLGTSAAA